VVPPARSLSVSDKPSHAGPSRRPAGSAQVAGCKRTLQRAESDDCVGTARRQRARDWRISGLPVGGRVSVAEVCPASMFRESPAGRSRPIASSGKCTSAGARLVASAASARATRLQQRATRVDRDLADLASARRIDCVKLKPRPGDQSARGSSRLSGGELLNVGEGCHRGIAGRCHRQRAVRDAIVERTLKWKTAEKPVDEP